MSQGTFDDETVDPKKTYWYRVVGIDYDGNETKLDQAAAISTFTFSRRLPEPPVLDLIVPQAAPCGIVLQWSPAFDTSKHLGFVVYRSVSAAGQYTPIVLAPLQTNSFTDVQVARGTTYWYQIGIMMKNGRLSALTAAQSITP